MFLGTIPYNPHQFTDDGAKTQFLLHTNFWRGTLGTVAQMRNTVARLIGRSLLRLPALGGFCKK